MSISCTALRSAIASFSFPWGRCSANRAKFCMDRKTLPCLQTPRSMYPSIYNSFPVIRTTIAKKCHFYVPRPSFFCLPWGRPCGNHAKRCMNEKTIQCLPNPSQHVPIYLQQFTSYSNRKCKKNRRFTYRSPHFCFLWRRPCDYHAICCMDGKTIQCF